MTGLYPVSFDFAVFTVTVFTILRSSKVNGFKNHLVETASEVSQKSNVKVMTYVKKRRAPKNSRLRGLLSLVGHYEHYCPLPAI